MIAAELLEKLFTELPAPAACCCLSYCFWTNRDEDGPALGDPKEVVAVQAWSFYEMLESGRKSSC